MVEVPKRSEWLLEDPDVVRWFKNLERGSTSNAAISLRSFRQFCEIMETTPKEMLKLNAKNLILDYIEKREGKVAGSSIKAELKPVRSWLAWNDIELPGRIRIAGANSTPSLRNESIPDKEGIRAIFSAANVQQKAAISLVAFSGVRLGVIGNYKGEDGLKIGDLPELRIEKLSVHFEVKPTMVRVRQELSKAGHDYFTFLGEEGCSYLQVYLQSRLENGERLENSTPLIANIYGEKHHIRTIKIGAMLRKPMRLAGNANRPYVLRSYFATQLMQAESRGFLRDYRVFMMGHKGDIEHTYTLNKNRLPKSVIEKIREAYMNSAHLLETKMSESANEYVRRWSLTAVGYSQEQIDQMDLKNMTDQEVEDNIRERVNKGNEDHGGNQASAQGINLNDAKDIIRAGMPKPGGRRQTIVPITAVESYVEQNYEYVAQLPNGKVIMRIPF